MVKALLVAGANPNRVSAQGNRLLDVARSSECIRLLLVYGANPSNVYEACTTYLPSSCPTTPEEPSVKVFIVGDSGAGKSTLTESLKKDISGLSGLLARVNPVSAEKKTTGIMPHKISSSKMGKFQVYDLAGDKEFYSSHDAIISTSLSVSSSAVFLLVVDLRPAPDDISHTIHYWLDFLQSKLSQNCPKPHLTIVGSHFDKMVQSEFTVKIEKLTSIQERAQTCGFDVKGIIAMNSLIAKSDGMTKLRRSLYASYESLRPQATMTFQSHCFHILLVSLSKDRQAIQIRTILDSCQKQLQHDVQKFLLKTPEGLCTLCDDLSERSLLLFFKNENALEESWIIIDQVALLSRVNGTVFASEGTKTYRELSTSTGVVPLSRITAEFGDLDPNMITQFLKHLQFCVEIEQDALKVIEPDAALDQTERHFLFPSLVREQAPTDIWAKKDKFTDYSGWQLKSSNPEQFFSARFLQLLLLRIAFQYAFPHSANQPSTNHPAIQRTCKVWKNGIYWEDEDLLSALVELHDDGRRVNILIRGQQGRVARIPALRLRIVQDVLRIKNEVCKNINIEELVLHPQAVMSYPIDVPQDKAVCGSKLAMAIARHKPGVYNLVDETIPISELLLYDRYSNDQDCKQEIDQLLARHSISVSKHCASVWFVAQILGVYLIVQYTHTDFLYSRML